MLFKQRFHQGLRDGSITLTFRRWKSPRVKAGGSYRLDVRGVLVVDDVSQVAVARIKEGDAKRSGFDSRADLLREIGAAGRVYRVAFRYAAQADERPALASNGRLPAAEARKLSARLDAMDARSRHGPWTRRVLRLIEQHPKVVASKLAKRLGRETQPFKADVRKLKRLGLTKSHDVGYELSPRGRALLKHERCS